MNLSPHLGTCRASLAALLSGEIDGHEQPAQPRAPASVDVESLLMTIAVGGPTPAIRAKASSARTALARLVTEAHGAVAQLRMLGVDPASLQDALHGVGSAQPRDATIKPHQSGSGQPQTTRREP